MRVIIGAQVTICDDGVGTRGGGLEGDEAQRGAVIRVLPRAPELRIREPTRSRYRSCLRV